MAWRRKVAYAASRGFSGSAWTAVAHSERHAVHRKSSHLIVLNLVFSRA